MSAEVILVSPLTSVELVSSITRGRVTLSVDDVIPSQSASRTPVTFRPASICVLVGAVVLDRVVTSQMWSLPFESFLVGVIGAAMRSLLLVGCGRLAGLRLRHGGRGDVFGDHDGDAGSPVIGGAVEANGHTLDG